MARDLHLFVTPWGPRGGGKPLEARVALDAVEDDVAASDHFAVLATLQIFDRHALHRAAA